MPCCSAARARAKLSATRIARAHALAEVAKAQRTGVPPKKVPAKKVPAKKVPAKKFKPSCTICGKGR